MTGKGKGKGKGKEKAADTQSAGSVSDEVFAEVTLAEIDLSPLGLTLTASFEGSVNPEVGNALMKCHTYGELKTCIVGNFPEIEDRRAFMTVVLEAVEHDQEKTNMRCASLVDFIRKNNLDLGIRPKKAEDDFPQLHKAAKEGRDSRDRIKEATIAIAKAFGEDVVNSRGLLPVLNAANCAKNFVTLTKKGYLWESVRDALVAAIIERLDGNKRGVAKIKYIQPYDMRRALEVLEAAKGQPVGLSNKQLKAAAERHQLVFDSAGLVYHKDQLSSIVRAYDASTEDMPTNAAPPPDSSLHEPTPMSTAVIRRESVGQVGAISPRHWAFSPSPLTYRPAGPSTDPFVAPTASPDQPIISPRIPRSLSGSLVITSTPKPGAAPPRFSPNTPAVTQRRVTSASSHEASLTEASFTSQSWQNISWQFERQSTAHRSRLATARENDSTSVTPNCTHCSNKVDRILLAELDTIMARKAKKNAEEQAELLARFGKAMKSAKIAENPYCVKHMRAMASIIGLKTHKLNTVTYVDKLFGLSRKKNNLARAKVAPTAYNDFRKGNRPALAEDALGVFRFFPTGTFMRSVGTELRIASGKDQLKRLQVLSGLTTAQIDLFKELGTVNIDLFSWWKDSGIMQILDDEFEMYDWHQREWLNNPNKGWLRTMIHGLGQQLMRQDIRYWAAYVLLREDHLTWLTSYPYYAKKTLKGDSVRFQHIDLNPHSMVETGRGVFQIQGTLSLDNESRYNCTTIVPKMHKKDNITEWSKRLVARNVSKDSPVVAIDDKRLTKDDLKDFKTSWVTVPCKALEVRISDPRLPHGSNGDKDGRADGQRRTMLPWFCGVTEDHTHLEVIEGGTWEEISAAHRDLKPAPRSPSGKPNVYGPVPYAFPGAVRIQGLSPISDALVAQRKWTDPQVVYYLNRILNKADDEELKKEVKEFQKKAAKEIKQAWEIVKVLEQTHFHKENSYFDQKAIQKGKMKRGTWNRPEPDKAKDDADEDSEISDEEDASNIRVPLAPHHEV